MESSASITADKMNFEILPFIRRYRSGRVERLYPSRTVPPSVDPRTGISSRDVTINRSARLSARLYLPPSVVASSPEAKKLPVVVYYHGGGFCAFKASSFHYHSYLNSLVSEAEVIAVSADYRLAPEHPLPAAYDDSWETLQWVAEHAHGCGGGKLQDRRLAEFGDFSKIFLAGDSAGANIVHNMGVKLGENGMEVEGLAMVHPYFWGTERMGSEKTNKALLRAADLAELWPFVSPGTAGLDDPRVNPLAAGGPSLAALGSRRVLVSAAERDLLRDRGRAYYERLREVGWGREAEFFETEGKDHVFHVFQRPERKAAELMRRLAVFFSEYVEDAGETI